MRPLELILEATCWFTGEADLSNGVSDLASQVKTSKVTLGNLMVIFKVKSVESQMVHKDSIFTFLKSNCWWQNLSNIYVFNEDMLQV